MWFIKQCPNCNVSLVLHNFIDKESFYFVIIAPIVKNLQTIVNSCQSENSIIFPGEGLKKYMKKFKKILKI